MLTDAPVGTPLSQPTLDPSDTAPPAPRPWPVPIVVMDRVGWNASGLFNPNRMRADLKPHAFAAGATLAMVHSASRSVARSLPDASAFMRILRNDPAFQGENVKPELLPVAVNNDRDFLGAVYNTLRAVKTFMDVYARLITRSIDPRSTIHGFNKDGQHVGGRVLNWLRGSAPSDYAHRELLAATIDRNVQEWITTAVTWRDNVIHDGAIPGFQEMCLVLARSISLLSVDAIQAPRMPDGMPAVEYADSLWARTQALIAETLPLLPGTQEPIES